MTIVMGLEACLWGFLTWLRVQERIAYSEPYSRLALILASVALFNVWAAWLVWGGRKAEEREARLLAEARAQNQAQIQTS
jgi:type VI protein secretion system component VasK